jgi:hypothetical protein
MAYRYRSRMTYHVTRGSRRTTVCLDAILSELLALKLGVEPDAAEAHAAVRQWLQAELDVLDDPDFMRISSWLRKRAIESVIRDELAEAHGVWLDKILSIP